MDRIEKYFHNLRFDENHHLGLGDIRITFAQQEQILSLCKAALAEKDKEIERLKGFFRWLIEEYGYQAHPIEILNEAKKVSQVGPAHSNENDPDS